MFFVKKSSGLGGIPRHRDISRETVTSDRAKEMASGQEKYLKLFECGFRRKLFGAFHQLVIHQRGMDAFQPLDTDGPFLFYVCGHCGKSFTEERSLSGHWTYACVFAE